ncbi:hypothetical protein SAMN04487926_12762 [Paraburkholderia steynii]|uniref:Uncharacterized protein n=1 Tax=Paraburkholderia steynii TaxID=1245441 RepID=A0A7Z7BDS4_9BURK|nr:hypothetical protein SAMN04487926_12762 [Paraburkholderia steynii]
MSQKALRVSAFLEQDRKIVMRISVRWVDFQTALIALLCIFKTIQILQSDRTVKVQRGIVRKVSQRLLEYVERVLAARFEFA